MIDNIIPATVSDAIMIAETAGETYFEFIQRMAALPLHEYEQCRKSEAKRLNMRAAVLDKEVSSARPKKANGSGGRPLQVSEVEPWDEEVDGDSLLDALASAFHCYLALPPGAAEALALWVVFAHTLDAFTHCPRLVLFSAEKRSGKTTCMKVLLRLVPRALPSSNISSAAVYRTIEAVSPTLLIDEADTFLRENEEMRGVVDSGHERDLAFVVRLQGDQHEPQQFATWAPMVIAMIGRPPDTIEDRAVMIPMRRRAKGEEVIRLTKESEGGLAPLAKQAARWAADNLDLLRRANPDIPESLHDRAADNWRPLFAIGDLAGGGWPERSRTAACQLVTDDVDDRSAGMMLLNDLRGIFAEKNADSLSSAQICTALAEKEDRPWPEWKGGKPITPRQLSRLLEPFEVKPKQLWDGHRNVRGYTLDMLKDAFARWIPGKYPLDPLEPAENCGFQANSYPLETGNSSGSKNGSNSQKSSALAGLADINSESRRERSFVIEDDPEERAAIQQFDG